MTNLGIMASQISGHLYDGPFGAYDSLAAVTLSSATSTITFAGIPSGYKHLQIRGFTLTPTAINAIRVRYNGDSGANYTRHLLEGGGTSAYAEQATGITGNNIAYTGGTANPGVFVMDILDYASTNKYKTVRSAFGIDQNGSGYSSLTSGLWLNTSAITSIEFTNTGSTNFNTYTSFALYGVK